MKYLIFICLCFIAFSTLAKDTLTGGDLLESCKSVLANTSNEMETMLCYWYITPCDCDHYEDETPRVCLPPKADEMQLARMIVKGLEDKDTLQLAKAQFAANTVLEKYYPCDPE